MKDTIVPFSVSESWKIPTWVDKIYSEQDALEKWNRWVYVKLKLNISAILYVSDFCVKDTFVTIVCELFKERCLLSGYKKVAYKDFHPQKLFAPAMKHENIKILFVYFSSQCLIMNGANVDKAYLYGHITGRLTIIMG